MNYPKKRLKAIQKPKQQNKQNPVLHKRYGDFVAIAVKVMYNIVNCYKSDLLLKKVTKNPTLIRFIIRGAPET